MNYHPRYTAHHWSPIDRPASKKYYGLDWFWANGDDDAAGSPAYVRLHLQRPAKVYLAVAPEWDADFPDATLTGWNAEGWVQRPDDDEDFVSGIHQQYGRWLPTRMYIFSKRASGSLDLPEEKWIEANVKGIKTSGYWYLMLAEPNGDAPEAPANPAGVSAEIVPNQRCPDALHELWVTENTDDDDEDTRGRKWQTWHPMYDPCYWCGYDHEHGSSPKKFMDYEPKYGYVAWKNEREDESHEGFKGHVFRIGPYFVYWSIHVQTSSLRRIDVKLHTITFVVVHAATKELLVEVNHKGFFGFLATRVPDPGDFIALTEADQKLREELDEMDGKRNKRSINVIDLDNLDPRFEYRGTKTEDILRGEYEDWTTGPLCGGRGRRGMITTDTTNPATAFKSVDNKVKQQLGFTWGDRSFKHDGSSRIVLMSDFEFGYDHCMFKLADIMGGTSKDGVFYTDPAGIKIVRGPGENSVKQFIKPGFSLSLQDFNVFDPVDVWTGLYEMNAERGVSSYGFVIDPEVN